MEQICSKNIHEQNVEKPYKNPAVLIFSSREVVAEGKAL